MRYFEISGDDPLSNELENTKRQIEEMRSKLHELLLKDKNSTFHILKTSESLDQLITKYYQLCEKDKY